MREVLPIPNVVDLVIQCWTAAEERTIQLLADRHWDQDEEFITQLFCGEFRSEVEALADTCAVAEAFLQDLWNKFPAWRFSTELNRLAEGVSATATFHPREVERVTGGDLGIVLLRPSVEAAWDGSTLSVNQSYARGILCQAKITQRSSGMDQLKWGELSPTQREVLQARTSYLALLLYKYNDIQRRTLGPFLWQLCENCSIEDISAWLKGNSFPELVCSADVIEGLGDCCIGTDDPEAIEEYIVPAVRDALVIRIDWPSDRPPPPRISVATRYRVRQRQLHQLW